MGLYVSVTYRGEWWGEDPITETRHETLGALYRALSGQDKSHPWEAMGRCTGKVYIDRDGDAVQVGWIFLARVTDENDRSCPPPSLREAWVIVHTAPDTVVRTPHYASFGKVA